MTKTLKPLKSQIVDYYVKYPDAIPSDVAKKFGTKTASNIYQYRKEATAIRAKRTPEAEVESYPGQIHAQETHKDKLLNTDQILNARAKDYGQFVGIATLTQNLLGVMAQSKNGGFLAADQAEALHMIAHKMARILNGDQDLADSWDDIAGYAKLVADRLQGHAR